MSEWISVLDSLPSEMQRIIVSGYAFDSKSEGRFVCPSIFVDCTFYGYAEEDDERTLEDIGALYWPTHWQPMPKAPQ